MDNVRAIYSAIIILVGMLVSVPAGAYSPVKRTELSNLCVNAIAQDQNGYIWIATANGLCKSYGDEYDIYFGNQTDTSTIPNNLVTNLHLAQNGWLMVATNLGVCALEPGTTTFHRFTTDGPQSALCYGFFDFGDRLFCYGVGGLYEVSFKDFQINRCIAMDGNPVTSVTVSPDGRLWFSDGHSLTALDSSMTQRLTVLIPGEHRIATLASGDENILIGTHNGMFSLDPATYQLTSTAIGGDTEVRHILPVNAHDFIVSTGNRGVLSYSNTTDLASSTFHNLDLSDINTPEVNSTFYDRDNNLWVATFARGEMMFTDIPRLFNADRNIVYPFRQDFVTRIAVDLYGNLWAGTRNNGIGILCRDNNTLRYFNSITHHFTDDYLHDFVQELSFDRQGRLWIGYNNSLVIAEPKYSSSGLPLDLRIIKIINPKAGVVSMAEDAKGQIWIGTSGKGILLFDRNSNLITDSFKGLLSNNITRIIQFDDNHILLSAYSDNIYLINVVNHSVKPLGINEPDATSNAIDLMIDRNRNIWIGTYHHGLFRIDAKTDSVTRCLDQLTCYDIVGLSQDRNGDVWASSSYGLYRFDNSGTLKNCYLTSNGLGGNQFHEKSVAAIGDGRLIFGGNAGIEEITPLSDIPPSREPIRIVNSGLWTLPDNSPALRDDQGITDIASVDHIDLSHDENSICIEYFAMNYAKSDGIEYSYMLQGRDKDFIFNGDHRKAYYSDLAAGNYDFYVRTRYNGEEWQAPQHLLTVSVKPNPWLSIPAIIFYILALLSLTTVAIRLYIRIRLIKHKYRLSEERIQQEKQLTANRINFFTNISHELRTPLTLIYGPAKHLRKNYKTMSSNQIEQSFDFIDSNIERLLTLINQLLSFRRVNNEILPLQVSKGDLAHHLESLSKLYAVYAVENNVTINFEMSPDFPRSATYDHDKIEKIVSNLLINAIKYSGDNGVVTLSLSESDAPDGIDTPRPMTYAIISVKDNGNGIENDEIPLIFQPFKRLLGIDKTKTEGFGIGLHFVAQLVKEHKGTIHTRKNPDCGMTFTIVIPVSDNTFESSEFKSQTIEVTTSDDSDTLLPAATQNDNTDNQPDEPDDIDNPEPDCPRLLVVDDNESNLQFITSIFCDKYEIVTASDGDSALKIIAEECPDIIISDVLMPGDTDGYDLCRQVKSNPESSHVPVVLLTAKTLDQNKIQGYNCGADAYLCKPYSPEVLIACVNNLNTKRIGRAKLIVASAGLQEHDADNSISTMELSPMDQKFLEKLYAYIDDNISDCELNVNILGRELGISRTNFYRKVKALTGVSPSDFLRQYRLNRAGDLLLSREYTVGEVAEKIGFDSHSHFSSLFKKHFGVSPRTYVSEHFAQRS